MSSAYPLIFRPPALGRPLPIPAALTAREILPGSPRIKISRRHFVKSFVSSELDQYKIFSEQGVQIPPFACAYNNRANGGKYLAIADEEGTVGFINTMLENHENDERISWRAHQNAIFDICWSPDDRHMVTASGDQTCKLWDVENTHMICLFAGHDCSVKSVTFDPMAPNVFATAARDGNIMIWDVRCTGAVVGDEYHHRAVQTINNAHANPLSLIQPSKSKAKKSLLVTQSYGVTAVRYLTLSPDILASSGAADGLVKFWDMRQHGAHWKKNAPQPVEKSALPEYATRPHGLSSLTLCPTGTRLFASCMDHSVHQYSTRNLGVPDAVFSSANLRICSFYVRTTVSPDGGFVACGSTDSGLHVWEVERPELPPLVMGAHQGEVTALSWSKTDFDELASCSDDLTVRVWKYRPQFDEEVEEDVAVRHLRGRTVEGMIRTQRPASVPPQTPSSSSTSSIRTHLATPSSATSASTTSATPSLSTGPNPSLPVPQTPHGRSFQVFSSSPVGPRRLGRGNPFAAIPNNGMSSSTAAMMVVPGSSSPVAPGARKRAKTLRAFFARSGMGDVGEEEEAKENILRET